MKVIGVSSGGLKGKLVNYNKIVHFTQLGKLLTITKSGNLLKIIGQNKYEQKEIIQAIKTFKKALKKVVLKQYGNPVAGTFTKSDILLMR